MITRIDATNYRCFEKVGVPLADLCVVAGANGSGKTTLLDIPVLLGDILRSRNVAGAFMERHLSRGARAASLSEVPFRAERASFTLGVEARLPAGISQELVTASPKRIQDDESKWPTHIRYELRLEIEGDHQLVVRSEYLFAFPHTGEYEAGRLPMQGESADRDGWRLILERDGTSRATSDASIRPETKGAKAREAQVDRTVAALPRLQYEPAAEFRAGRWLLDLLLSGVVFFDPAWSELRQASPPGLPKSLMGTGKNLPWLALQLQNDDEERFAAWVAHVQTALPQVESITVREREEDHHAYFRVEYEGGFAVTSSGLSEGTLRILALTLVPYLADVPPLLVVEEPENSIHPQAIETIMQSLRSLYDQQVWVSTHSPIVLADASLDELLITRLDRSGAANVVPGREHPRLSQWKGAIDLGSLFASGVFE